MSKDCEGNEVMNLEELQLRMSRNLEIGMALSSERDVEVLLEMIVDEARRMTSADGGTLFLVDVQAQVLQWAIVQNETMGIAFGGKSAGAINPEHFQPIALFDDTGEAAMENVATYAAHTAEPVRIGDAYDEHDDFDFAGPIRFDEQTGYRTRSIMVVPLCHFEGGVVGVLQLINARDADGESRPFDERDQQAAMGLASQAAVAVKNALLFAELEAQFEAFIEVIASAIDEKSPYTAGHVKRVVDVAMRIAHAINEADDGPFAEVTFSADELKALKIASWMHDIGKIATPEYVIDKATKLETIFDRISIVRERFARIKLAAQHDALLARLALWEQGAQDRESREQAIQEELDETLQELDEELAFIERCNPGKEFMSDELIDRIKAIAQHAYTTSTGEVLEKLTPNEVENLSIRRGTLTSDEIAIIRDHARISYVMLKKLPFSRHLVDVPEIAAGHHEKLNGKGYPRGLTAEQLTLPARILAVADIFEALSARDRPYKKPSPLTMVNRILGFMIKDGELDERVIDFARSSGVFDAYAEAEVSESQRDYHFASGKELT